MRTLRSLWLSLLIALAFASNAGAVGFVKSAVGDSNSGTTCTLAFSGGNTSGNQIGVIAYYANSVTVSSITDTQTNTYTFDKRDINGPSVTRGLVAHATVGSTAANTITITFSGSTNCGAVAHEVNGLGTVDTSAVGGNSTTTGTNNANPGAMTFAGADYLMLAGFDANGAAVTAGTTPIAFTGRASNNGFVFEFSEDATVSAGTQTPTVSVAGTAQVLVGGLAFSPSGGGGCTAPPNGMTLMGIGNCKGEQ